MQRSGARCVGDGLEESNDLRQLINRMAFLRVRFYDFPADYNSSSNLSSIS